MLVALPVLSWIPYIWGVSRATGIIQPRHHLCGFWLAVLSESTLISVMQTILNTGAPSSSSCNLFGERAFGVSGP